jgi:hypothetical protein
LKPSGADAHKLSRALDAVNSTVNWFWSMSRNPGYDFEKHKNNWDDIQQLYYLCDPTMTFVTLNTRDFMQWTKNSPQASQVVSWKEFCKNARAASQRPVKDGL